MAVQCPSHQTDNDDDKHASHKLAGGSRPPSALPDARQPPLCNLKSRCFTALSFEYLI